MISKKIRNSAKGQECQVRLNGICNFNPETTVYAHIARGSGMGQKCNDIHGTYCCSACHDEIDRRTRKLELEFVQNAAYEGMVRTQLLLIENQLLKVA
jgi:hypothetical protein